MRLKRIALLNFARIAVVACGGILLAPMSGLAAPQPPCKHIRLGTLAQGNTSPHRALLEMRDKWREAPGGGVRLTVYPGTMGSESDMVRRMRVGQLQAAMLTASGISEINPDAAGLQKMPLVYRTLEEAEYAREQLRKELERGLEEKGFVVLFWGDGGWVRFFTRRPARHPDEFKAMKMFVEAGDNGQIQVMKEMGFNPVPLEWSDVLTSLQTGMVDAVPVIPLFALGGQFYTVTKHMVEVNWVPLQGAAVVTKSCWDSIPGSAREAMLDTAREAGAEITASARAESDAAVAAMQSKHGLQVQPMTPEMEAEWRHVAEELYPKIRGRLVPADIFDQVLALLSTYRSSAGGQK